MYKKWKSFSMHLPAIKKEKEKIKINILSHENVGTKKFYY